MSPVRITTPTPKPAALTREDRLRIEAMKQAVALAGKHPHLLNGPKITDLAKALFEFLQNP